MASDDDAANQSAGPVGLKTLIQFLTGRRSAILNIAGSRGATWIGLLFVISAGFARDYDQEDLLREPWHLLIPIAASVGLSFILHVMFRLTLTRRNRPSFWSRYRVFLTLFWMTAPMAWLYAIPYERFLNAGDSVQANLLTLALVAVWRVLLISRVISVLTNQTFLSILVVVVTIADLAVQIALRNVSLPLLSIMGGVSLSRADLILANVTLLVQVLGTGLLVLFIVPALIIVVAQRRAAIAGLAVDIGVRVSPGFVAVGVGSVVIWAGILPFTQPEQRLRWKVERDLKSGRVPQAIETMSAHRREDFPPHWDPPPRIGYREESPPLLDVMELLCDGRGERWVREIYLDKFERGYMGFRPDLSPAEVARVWSIVNRLPERDRLLTKDLRWWHEQASATQPATGPATRPRE